MSIAHACCIQIKQNARVGKSLRIHEGVTIGAFDGENVFLGTDFKVIGDIRIANSVTVGTNAVVVKDILENEAIVQNTPAIKISENDSFRFVFCYKKFRKNFLIIVQSHSVL